MPAVILEILTSTDGSIASIFRSRGCYVSYGIIITIVSYLWYLYFVVLEIYVLHAKRKKIRLPAYYVRAYRVYAVDSNFLVCQLLLQSDNCEMMSFLFVAFLRSG